MDAANVDLKGFTDEFYYKLCGARLQPVLDLLAMVHHGTGCWLEITTLLIPGHNDSDLEIADLSRWVERELGPDVPLHFTAFHPDYKMPNVPATPPAHLPAQACLRRTPGLNYVYTGNVHNLRRRHAVPEMPSRHGGPRLVSKIKHYDLTPEGACPKCGTLIAGRFTRFEKPSARAGSRFDCTPVDEPSPSRGGVVHRSLVGDFHCLFPRTAKVAVNLCLKGGSGTGNAATHLSPTRHVP